MLIQRKLNLIFILLLCLFVFNNCEQIADAAFSDKDDIEMGANLDKEIRSKPTEFPILVNNELQGYVQSIVKQLIRSPLVKRKKTYSYKVTILNDDKAINAFCTPGGYIYVYTGLLKFLDNEASLAAVLSHEIAHAEKRHVRQRMLSAMGVQLIVSAILGNGSSVFKEMGLQIAGTLALLSNSRGDELEADELGFLYLQSSPYYQGAMSYFFEKIAKEEKRNRMSKAVESLLSTHPIPEERLKANSERIRLAKIQPPIPSNLLETRYKSIIKKHLRAGSTLDGEPIDDRG
ncbi:MAG: M48 family metalloprotease [Leptospiraceae bacterium]|nr:M48 family metalloprotease [Leptospiraceae bacterium]MBP9165613.1 M48 family metalloprotease [Leptospiraceae bacterium]